MKKNETEKKTKKKTSVSSARYSTYVVLRSTATEHEGQNIGTLENNKKT